MDTPEESSQNSQEVASSQSTSRSSILCPWEELMKEFDEKEEEQVEDEWLPGELEYYQAICNELYPQKKKIADKKEENEQEEVKAELNPEGDTTEDPNEFSDDDEDVIA